MSICLRAYCGPAGPSSRRLALNTRLHSRDAQIAVSNSQQTLFKLHLELHGAGDRKRTHRCPRRCVPWAHSDSRRWSRCPTSRQQRPLSPPSPPPHPPPHPRCPTCQHTLTLSTRPRCTTGRAGSWLTTCLQVSTVLRARELNPATQPPLGAGNGHSARYVPRLRTTIAPTGGGQLVCVPACPVRRLAVGLGAGSQRVGASRAPQSAIRQK